MTASNASLRSLAVGRWRYPVVLPKLSDPRLHLAAVIFSLQALGQTVLRFELSIAQILTCLLTTALLEFLIVGYRDRVIAWPASALLTGNGVAFLMRVPGTEAGDYWSWRGAHLFAAVSALSILSKHLFVVRSSHVFNPSNLGLTVGFLVLGSTLANPQDLWWGPISPAIVATLVVISAGAILVTGRSGLLGVAAGFWVTFAGGIGLLAATGNAMTARWHFGLIEGRHYWTTFVTSPEILIFMFFMITDPKTIPRSPRSRIAFGVAVGAVASLFVAPQRTEFAAKVAVLAALVVVCVARVAINELRRRTEWAQVLAVRVGAARPWALAAPTVAGVVALLLVFGNNVEPGATAGDLSEVSALREQAEASVGALPAVEIDESVERVDATLDQQAAERIVLDVLVNLALIEVARDLSEPEYLAAAATTPVLDDLTDALAANTLGSTGGKPTLARLEIVRNLSSPQAPPRFGVRLSGINSPLDPSMGDPTFVMASTGDAMVLAEILP